MGTKKQVRKAARPTAKKAAAPRIRATKAKPAAPARAAEPAARAVADTCGDTLPGLEHPCDRSRDHKGRHGANVQADQVRIRWADGERGAMKSEPLLTT
jgi:hypothetical protein